MHALYCNDTPVREIVDYYPIDTRGTSDETLGVTIVLENGDVLDVNAADLHVTDEFALALIAAAQPGAHRLDNAGEDSRTVLGIVRRLSVEDPSADYAPDRARIIDAREAAGYDVSWERLAELALQDGLAVLARQAAA